MLQLTTTIPSASHEKTSPMDSWSYGSYVHVEPASSQPWSSGTGTPVTSMDWDQNALYHGNPAVSNVASPESAGGGELKDLKSVDAPPPRKRISRACDQCNQLRTKCDGDKPCAHCISFGLVCEYKRERKKRGKVSRKDLQHQQMVAATSTASGDSAARFSLGRSRATSGVQSPAGPYANSNLPCNGRAVDQISRSPTEYAVANHGNNLSEVNNKLNDMDDYGTVGAVTGTPVYGAPVGAFAMTGPHTPTTIPFQHFSPGSNGTACFSGRARSNNSLGLTNLETSPEHRSATIYSEDLPCTPTDDVIHVPESCDRCDLASNSCLSAAGQVGSSHQEVRTVATSRASLRQPAAILTGSAYNQWSPGAYSLPSPAPSAGQYPHPEDTGLAFRYPALQAPTSQLDPMMPPNVAYDLLDVYLAEFNHANVHPLSYTRQQPAEGSGRVVDDFLRS